jgi:hypothetical protein
MENRMIIEYLSLFWWHWGLRILKPVEITTRRGTKEEMKKNGGMNQFRI